ncbi:YfjI family protein [Parafrankia sp. BMG5.11]|uniref:YfjI family protein n=1 Tax=Parafrankia sp. BMG5.11 TaxID=222540 RepID=UPI0010392A01|nr:YfjI family protein [Parafrankia sp. BMG5.11]TCJ38823.1 DUF3987 domain-containing protein [Parafrankia sp. BMG5.11]
MTAAIKEAFASAETINLWCEPRELPGGLHPVEQFSCELLPAHLRDWVDDISERMQTPPEYVAIPAMVGAATVVGRKLAIRPKQQDDWKEVPNLWGCIIGRPGVMKSPAIGQALKPLNRLSAFAGERFERERAEYDAADMERDLRKEASKAAMKKALSTNAQADVSNLRFVDEEGPTLRRYSTNDSSYQALGDLLRHNTNGLLVYKDELMGLLKPLDREENSEARAFYLQGWNGDGSYTFDRIGRGANLHVPALTISVLGSTQPAKIQSYVDGVVSGSGDDGLLQRFSLAVWPDASPSWEYVDRLPRAEYRQAAFDVFDHLDRLTPDSVGAVTDEHDARFPYLRFDAEAGERFKVWLSDLMRRLRADDMHPALESHFAKYRSLVPSMALLHHLMSGKTGSVGLLSVLSGIAWSDYLEGHARRIYGSAVNDTAQAAKAILRHIRAGDLENGFNRREIERRGWAGLQSNVERIQAGLGLLVDYSWLREVPADQPGERGGRPALPTYIINPAVRG